MDNKEAKPTHYALPTEVFQAVLQILAKLPWESVNTLMPEVMKARPFSEEKKDGGG